MEYYGFIVSLLINPYSLSLETITSTLQVLPKRARYRRRILVGADQIQPQFRCYLRGDKIEKNSGLLIGGLGAPCAIIMAKTNTPKADVLQSPPNFSLECFGINWFTAAIWTYS
jgi:hypothetical protein